MPISLGLTIFTLVAFSLLCLGAFLLPHYLIARARGRGQPNQPIRDGAALGYDISAQLAAPGSQADYYIPPVETVALGERTTRGTLVQSGLLTIAAGVACFFHLVFAALIFLDQQAPPNNALQLPSFHHLLPLLYLYLALYSLLVGALVLLPWSSQTRQRLTVGWVVSLFVIHVLL
jgi:hypothetical protein